MFERKSIYARRVAGTEMPRRRLACLAPLSCAVLVLAGGVIAGCGDDDSDSGLSRDELTESVNTICRDSDERNAELFAPLEEGEELDDDEMQEIVDGLVDSARQATDEMAKLSPPSSIADDYEAMVGEYRAATDAIEKAGLGFFEQVMAGEDPFAEASGRAGELGFSDCVGDE